MPPAVIAAGVVAAGSIGGALLGSHAQSKANKQAAQTQDNATNAQLQLGHESLDLNKQIYNSNYDTLSPWVSRGNVAGDAYSALLGLPTAPVMHSPLASPAPAATPAPAAGGQGLINPPPVSSPPVSAGGPGGGVMQSAAAVPTSTATPTSPPTPATAPMSSVPAPATTPAPSGATDAFKNFANSAGMQFQLDQGADMINNRYAALGELQSGEAMKALQGYGQQTALNNYFMPYMGMLGGLSAQGAQAGSAIAGVGSNFGNTAANINSQMGSAINSGAQNIGNLQLANGQNQANLYGQIGGALGKFGSSFMPIPQY
jgi:hypothetical protein